MIINFKLILIKLKLNDKSLHKKQFKMIYILKNLSICYYIFIIL